MTDSMKRLRIVVKGRVQGVGFRYFTQMQAEKLGVTGWCTNCADGSVLIEAQGTDEQLGHFLDCLRQGPPLAQVSDLASHEVPVQLEEHSFRIRYGRF